MKKMYISAILSSYEIIKGYNRLITNLGGRVDSVVNALIAAQRAGISLSFEKASAIDLAGRDVFEAVK